MTLGNLFKHFKAFSFLMFRIALINNTFLKVPFGDFREVVNTKGLSLESRT